MEIRIVWMNEVTLYVHHLQDSNINSIELFLEIYIKSFYLT